MGIHVWDLLNMNGARMTVDVSNSLKEEIKKKINEKVFSFSKELNITPSRLYEYFIWKKSQIPLSILFTLSRKLNIPDARIEKNIISYKQFHVPSNNSIKNPILPIQITPYLTSIMANLFFDGSVPEDGKGTYYNQKDNQIMGDFIKKVKESFGDVQYSLRKDHRGVLKCRLPRIIGEICRYAYNIGSFGTFDAKFPKTLYELNEEHKISFVLTGIIDEGSISYDSSVIFSISNKEMITNFNQLCNEIGLKTGGIKQKKNSPHCYLYILSTNKLNNLIDSFRKKYPLISLRHKAERLKKSLEIKNQKHYNTKKFSDKRKALILEELKGRVRSVNFLADKFLIPPRTIRRYMYNLIRENKINRIKKGNEYAYSLG